MNKVANTYWTDTRLIAQRPAARTLALESPVHELTRSVLTAHAAISRTEVRRRGGFSLPSWTIFTMIIMATFAMCVTVNMRTHAGLRAAAQRYERMNTEVENLRHTNAAIEREIERLRTDPRAIETAARTRLNMVRANEIIVPID